MSTGGYAPGTTRSNRRTKTRRSVIDYIITDDLDKIIEAGICDRESADIGSDHRALFIHADVAFSGGRAGRRRGNFRGDPPTGGPECPYSRWEVRGAEETLNELVTNMIKEKIEKG